MMQKFVLSIDPGRVKCGVAMVERSEKMTLKILWRGVIPTETLIPKMDELLGQYQVDFVIVGGGTTSSEVIRKIVEHRPTLSMMLVDETDSSLKARERYWEHTKRRGWRRFLPSSLQMPPEPVDDFAAYVLAEKVLLA